MFSFFKKSSKKNIPNGTTSKIKMTDVYKAFGDKKVLNGVDLEIKKG